MVAGVPVRESKATDLNAGVIAEGFVKVRLGHSTNGSVLIPDLVFAKDGPWRYFQPSFFGPPILGFNVEPGLHVANFSVDVAASRARDAHRLMIRILSNQHKLAFPDGSQLYACQIQGPKNLAAMSSGRCTRSANGDFILQLFHHTNKSASSKILGSNELWSSSWNLQGTRKLKNVSFAYLTSLRKIEVEEDLHRIAMSSNEVLRLQTTSNRFIEETLELKVIRSTTAGRTHSIEIGVASELLAPAHLHFHPNVGANPAYYAIVGPEIFRVGLVPGAALKLQYGMVIPQKHDLKSFSYIVVGDTSSVVGLEAPFDEETTTQIMHHELLDKGMDLFDFWQVNANSDQMVRTLPEVRTL